MKKFLFTLFITACFATINAQEIPKPTRPPFFDSDRKPENCMFKGYSMNARVRIVSANSSSTFKVRAVKDGEGGEDLTVRFVTNTRSSCDCGQWEIVETREDFTVAFVESGEDFVVRITEPY